MKCVSQLGNAQVMSSVLTGHNFFIGMSEANSFDFIVSAEHGNHLFHWNVNLFYAPILSTINSKSFVRLHPFIAKRKFAYNTLIFF